MKTLFVSGSDTAVGKTWVVATLASRFAAEGLRIQIVKPIESGAVEPDAKVAANASGHESVKAYTLRSLEEPIAPVAAAEGQGIELSTEGLIRQLNDLPECDLRIVEGAGSIATPIDNEGRDWADFASRIDPVATVLVVDYKLGAIGQARMATAYARKSGLLCGVWLNQTAPQEDRVLRSTLSGLEQTGTALWGVQGFQNRKADWLDFPVDLIR